MSLNKKLVAIGAVLVCTSLVWGCGNGNNNTSRSAVDQPNQNEQAQSWGDPKRLEASHLEALERMEKDHIHRMVSLSVSTDEDQVMTTLERSSQKLEEMRPSPRCCSMTVILLYYNEFRRCQEILKAPRMQWPK